MPARLDVDVAQIGLGRAGSNPGGHELAAARGRPRWNSKVLADDVLDRHVVEDAVLPQVGQERFERLGLGPERGSAGSVARSVT